MSLSPRGFIFLETFHLSPNEFGGFFRPCRASRGGSDRLKLYDSQYLLNIELNTCAESVSNLCCTRNHGDIVDSSTGRTRSSGLPACVCVSAHAWRIYARWEHLFSPRLHFSTPLNGPPCRWPMRTLAPLPRRPRDPWAVTFCVLIKLLLTLPMHHGKGCGGCRRQGSGGGVERRLRLRAPQLSVPTTRWRTAGELRQENDVIFH